MVKVLLGGCTVDALWVYCGCTVDALGGATVDVLWMHNCTVDALGGCTVDVLWMHSGCKAWPPLYSLLRVRLMFKDASRDNPPPVASIQGGLSLSLDWVVIGGCSFLKKSPPCLAEKKNTVWFLDNTCFTRRYGYPLASILRHTTCVFS